MQPELALTLRRIANDGAREFYTGKTAELLVAEMERHGGLISREDLRSYRPVIRQPVHGRYRGYDVYSMPPPSSGGVHVVQLLNILEGYPLKETGHNAARTIQLLAEAMKRAYADRSQYLGDSDFVKVPLQALTAKDYAAAIREQIAAGGVTPSAAIAPGKLAPYESDQTTHFSVVDRFGNAVANTTTINFSYGSGIVVDGAGFLLNNEMDDFAAKPGVPNAYGVVGSAANAIEPEKRMLSSMTPTILLQDGRVAMVVGTPGGATIFTSVFQAILNIVDFDMSAFAATDAARFHHQLLPPDAIYYGPSRPLPPETVSGLEGRGYRVTATWDFGDLQLIYVDDGEVSAASDPRHGGESRVFD